MKAKHQPSKKLSRGPSSASAATSATAISDAIALYSQGNYAQALEIASKALNIDPDNAVLLNVAAACARCLGDLALAERHLRKAISLQPDYTDAYNTLGVMLRSQRRFDEAEAAYRRALEIQPGLTDVRNNLGNLLKDQGRLAEAEAEYRRTLELKPDFPETINNLGLILQILERHPEAEAAFRRVIELSPGFAEAQVNLGNSLKTLRRLDEAEAAYRRALEIHPGYADACNNLGILYKGQNRVAEAEAAYRRALEIRPNYPEALNNMGLMLKDVERTAEAEAAFRQAIAAKPDYPDALINLGTIYTDQRRMDEAEALYHRALEVVPDQADALNSLAALAHRRGGLQSWQPYTERCLKAHPDNAQAHLTRLMLTLPVVPADEAAALQAILDFDGALAGWEAAGEQPEILRKIAEVVGHLQPFHLAYRDGNHVERLRRYAAVLAKAMAAEWAPEAWPKVPGAVERVRIAIISQHIRRHSVWDIVLHGIMEHLDRTRFEIVLLHTSAKIDGETELAKSLSDRSYDNCVGLERILDIVRREQPDVIFYPEIGMDTMACKLASLRLAPLQVASWGHPVTSGFPTIDLFFSGELLEPAGAEAHYSERLVRLPGTGVCTLAPPVAAEAVDRQALGLPSDRKIVCFALCQQPFKFDPVDDDTYVRIAQAVGPCQFWLVCDPKLRVQHEVLHARMAAAFRKGGLDPADYLRDVPWFTQERFYGFLDEVDVFLDCPNFSGYTTAWQAVHRGTPIVTLEGGFMRQRLAAGLLRQIGITEGIAASRDDYVRLAVASAHVARDTAAQAARRAAIRAAAPKADRRVDTVRAFEAVLLDTLRAKGFTFPWPAPTAEAPMPPTPPAPPPAAHAWQLLGADLHMHTLNTAYAPAALLQMVASAPRTVLDVGCFCGGTGRWLKEKFPGCRVTGIEHMAPAAALAREVYDKVVAQPFEEVDFAAEGLLPGSIDAIILADVLEHMINPWLALQRLRPLLSPEGALYISLPNIRNLNILMGLSRGEWKYAGAGILDVTHLRFFTLAQAKEMLAQTGWQVGTIRINRDASLMPVFEGKAPGSIGTIQAGNMRLENLTEQDVLELQALQFLIQAVPG